MTNTQIANVEANRIHLSSLLYDVYDCWNTFNYVDNYLVSWGGNESAKINAIHDELKRTINDLKVCYDELENLVEIDITKFVADQRRTNDG